MSEETIEIIEVAQVKKQQDSPFGSFLGSIKLIPEQDIPEGKKRTQGDKVFINYQTYQDMKNWLPRNVAWFIDKLEEVEE